MWSTIAFVAAALLVLLIAVTIHDVTQRSHAILRNFPVIGHLRYLLESFGPELRQYIVTGNNEERPFSRAQRRWVYASSKRQNNYFAFGTDQNIEDASNYLIVRHASFPLRDPLPVDPDFDPGFRVPCAKVLGGARGRRNAFRPGSIVNVSGMSFGSLSGPAVEALNRGSQIAGCLQNTGEGGVSEHHLHGGDLVWQIGTGYFGCRDEQGRFSMERFLDVVQAHPSIRAIEVKMSQGAKPGVGGMLPAAKISPEIARARGVPLGQDCISPSCHSAFHDVDSLLDFVEQLAQTSGLPVGIKSAVGQMDFWRELAQRMANESRGVDFVTVDGGEGGTGAAPLVFADHVALPFRLGFSQVFREFVAAGVADDIVFGGSGKLGFPQAALLAFALGCDVMHVGREAMLAIGCIQAQRCHTGACPTGVATQSRWLMRGLDPELKSARLANYVVNVRKELLRLSRACGVPHPAMVTLQHFDLINQGFVAQPATEFFGYQRNWGLPSAKDQAAIPHMMAPSRPDAELRTH